MDECLSVLWTIEAQDIPQPLLHCSHCGKERPFRSSGRFRLNANGRRIDAWLIYKCAICDGTWNRPLLERRSQAAVARTLLEALRRNDPELARRIGFDLADLRQHCAAVEQTDGVTLRKEVASQPERTVLRLEIRLAVPRPPALRLDRLLAKELGLSRTRLQALCAGKFLVLLPDGPRALRRSVRDGTRICLDLSREADAAALTAAACGE